MTVVRDEIVDFTHHYFWSTGEELISSASLRFRSESALREALKDTGFTVERSMGAGTANPQEKVTASSSSSLVRDAVGGGEKP